LDREISNPHDKLFKQLLGEPGSAASFLTHNLPGELASQLDLSTLQVVHTSFIDAQFIQSEADLLFSVDIANRSGYVYILFEHQSSPDAFMALRLLGYMVQAWKRFQHDNPQRKRLPAIIPMVLFHGPRGWRRAPTFESLVDMPDKSFAAYTPKFQYRLFDLSPFGKDTVAGNAEIRILGDVLGALGRKDFMERVTRAFGTLNELSQAPGFARYLEVLFRYVLEVYDIPKDDLVQLVTCTLKHDVKETIMTTYERLIEEGIQIGANRVLVKLLSKRFHSDVAPLTPFLNKLTPEQQEELSEKILEAQSLEEILDWLKSICRN
jgi:predicted transposase YdaD